MFKFLRKIIVWSLFGLFLAVIFAFASHKYIEEQSAERIFSDIKDIPACDVAIVLGTSPILKNGNTNLYFEYRIQKAIELYKAGKVKHFILSGDNHSEDYDEPEAMKLALIKGGIPEKCISLDYAGFRTLDSIVRAKEIFGQTRFIVISQKFHNERAVYLAQALGIEAYAANAQEVNYASGLYTKTREYLARAKALLDINILHTSPKFLGEKITLPL